jgi:hypothetical protein
MRKTYDLRPEGKHPDRVLDAIRHDIRRYLKRERRRGCPEGVDFWDFDCRFGPDQAQAVVARPAELSGLLDALARTGAAQCYVEILARPGVRGVRPTAPTEEGGPEPADSAT